MKLNTKIILEATGIVLVVVVLLTANYKLQTSSAATNVSATTTEHWGWNDVLGWIDFYNTNSVTVKPSKVEGYASSSAGDISLDCATTRSGDICYISDYRVTNDGNGNLGGWGWNDIYGWLSFWCGNNDGCGGSSYRVTVTPSGTISTFEDYAWNDILGWVSFNCSNTSGCGTSNYKVSTSWVATSTSGILDSSTYDTGVALGAQINSIVWQGSAPSGTRVDFQLAVATSTAGPWNYSGCSNPNSTCGSNLWYTGNPDTPISLDYDLHNNFRYFRYRIRLTSNQAQTLSPRVDSVHVNWSR